ACARPGGGACPWAAWRARFSKSPSPQSRRAKPATTKPGGSRPRLARSYMAGISFLRARSPVTPKITRAHGSGIRGSRRSWGSRSGLLISMAPHDTHVMTPMSRHPGKLVDGGQQPRRPGRPVGQVQPDQRPAPTGQRLAVAGGLRGFELPERERSTRDRQILDHRTGDLQERPVLRPALVVLAGRVQVPGAPAERDGL